MEIKLCILFEEKNINYCNKEIKIYNFIDVIFCLYSKEEDSLKHLSGDFVGLKTADTFGINNRKYSVFEIDVNFFLNELNTKNINSLISILKYEFYDKKFFETSYGKLNVIQDKEILKIAKKEFEEVVIEYYDLIAENKKPNEMLKINIDSIVKGNCDYKTKNKLLDSELDNYNSYIKKYGNGK